MKKNISSVYFQGQKNTKQKNNNVQVLPPHDFFLWKSRANSFFVYCKLSLTKTTETDYFNVKVKFKFLCGCLYLDASFCLSIVIKLWHPSRSGVGNYFRPRATLSLFFVSRGPHLGHKGYLNATKIGPRGPYVAPSWSRWLKVSGTSS